MTTDLEVVTGLEQQFRSDGADGVDDAGALMHVDAMRRLAARGITEPTDDEYAAALAYDATTLPLPAATPQRPTIVHHADPNLHSLALVILQESNLIGEPDQSAYDAAISRARRRLGR